MGGLHGIPIMPHAKIVGLPKWSFIGLMVDLGAIIAKAVVKRDGIQNDTEIGGICGGGMMSSTSLDGFFGDSTLYCIFCKARFKIVKSVDDYHKLDCGHISTFRGDRKLEKSNAN